MTNIESWRYMRSSSWTVFHWCIIVKLHNGERHRLEIDGGGVTYNKKKNAYPDSAEADSENRCNKTWGELVAFVKGHEGKYNLFTNNCYQFADDVRDFLKE